MKYFYDTEFLDNGKTVDLISIGIVAEDGREYYAVNRDADWDAIEQNDWIMENVVAQLPDIDSQWLKVWKFKERIRDEVYDFLTGGDSFPELWAWFAAYDHLCLSQLWGRMIDVPYPIPQFTHDVRSYLTWSGAGRVPGQKDGMHDALEDARHVKALYEYLKEVA